MDTITKCLYVFMTFVFITTIVTITLIWWLCTQAVTYLMRACLWVSTLGVFI